MRLEVVGYYFSSGKAGYASNNRQSDFGDREMERVTGVEPA